MDVLGLDIGGTKCAVVRGDSNGRVLAREVFATAGVEETLTRLTRAVEALGPGPAPVFGVSCGGPLDWRRGVVMSPPNLPGWDDVPITAMLEKRFGGKAYLMNDANAGALAEWKFGAARGCENVVFLTCGTGMGGGLILNGRLYEGATGMAGEVGHMRLAPDGPVGHGKAGSFEG
ncbi:MAG TPA: ROK family protein, partial [Candidatus Brocadiia bacterium]|nr:ROK family protein [Candidatus Brocadiia bacterium]